MQGDTLEIWPSIKSLNIKIECNLEKSYVVAPVAQSIIATATTTSKELKLLPF